MVFILSKLKARPRVFSRLVGVSVKEFEVIAQKCLPLWDKTKNKKKVSGRPYGLGVFEMHLLCVLLYYRAYISQLFLGFLFNVDSACICRSIKRLEPILAQVVTIKKDRTLTEEEVTKAIVDCTEQKIQRPGKKQRKYYSGKKKLHTLKTEIRISDKGKILSVSNPEPGSKHDFAIYKKQRPLHRNCHIYADSGYQGLDKKRSKVSIPIKKPRDRKLTSEEKKYNRDLSSFRVRVENKIRQLKIFNILSQTYRNFCKGYKIKMNIIAGIVNLKAGF
ncbi:MAG: transposase family protein [Desulfonauticus sp.]|nr:transposase family protein [Desulfonauticus sp.]